MEYTFLVLFLTFFTVSRSVNILVTKLYLGTYCCFSTLSSLVWKQRFYHEIFNQNWHFIVGLFDVELFAHQNSKAITRGFQEGQNVQQILNGLLDNYRIWLKLYRPNKVDKVHAISFFSSVAKITGLLSKSGAEPQLSQQSYTLV